MYMYGMRAGGDREGEGGEKEGEGGEREERGREREGRGERQGEGRDGASHHIIHH